MGLESQSRAEAGQGAARRQIDEAYVQALTSDRDLARGDGQAEAAWTRAARIHEKPSIPFLDERLMRMTRDDHTRTAGCRPLGEFGSVVKHVNAHTAQPQCASLGNVRRPPLGIVVAANGVQRGKGAQLAQDTRRTDVSRVENAIRVLEECLCLRPQKAMRIGNQADPKRRSAGRPR
jgi:hypothetical protein